MGITTTYTYLGALKGAPGAYHLGLGKYKILAADLYQRATKCVFTFAEFSKVEVLGMHSDCIANTALVPSLASVSGNVVTVAILEGAADAVVFPEKTNAEAYGQDFSFYVLVAGQ